MVPLVACERCVVLSVVSLVSRERSEAVSVVSPLSCVVGRGGDGGDVSFKRGLMVAVVVLLLVISFVRVKPVAPPLGSCGAVV